MLSCNWAWSNSSQVFYSHVSFNIFPNNKRLGLGVCFVWIFCRSFSSFVTVREKVSTLEELFKTEETNSKSQSVIPGSFSAVQYECGESAVSGEEIEEGKAGCACHLLAKWCLMTARSRRIEQIPIHRGPHGDPLVLTHKPEAMVLIVEAKFNSPSRCTREWSFWINMIKSELWNNRRPQSGFTLFVTKVYQRGLQKGAWVRWWWECNPLHDMCCCWSLAPLPNRSSHSSWIYRYLCWPVTWHHQH